MRYEYKKEESEKMDEKKCAAHNIPDNAELTQNAYKEDNFLALINQIIARILQPHAI
jgi:hypothetical protein